jgi:hypothetical protein
MTALEDIGAAAPASGDDIGRPCATRDDIGRPCATRDDIGRPRATRDDLVGGARWR